MSEARENQEVCCPQHLSLASVSHPLVVRRWGGASRQMPNEDALYLCLGSNFRLHAFTSGLLFGAFWSGQKGPVSLQQVIRNTSTPAGAETAAFADITFGGITAECNCFFASLSVAFLLAEHAQQAGRPAC